MKNQVLKILKSASLLFRNTSPLRKGKKGTFIFIHTNKTGGTSVAQAIGLPHKRHLTVKEVIKIIGEKKFKEAIKFSVVRNPWSKVVSHYKYRVKTNQTEMKTKPIAFKDWVLCTYGENKNNYYYNSVKNFQPQVEWLKDNSGKVVVNKILKFENLSADFKNLATEIGIENELPHLNMTAKDDYRKFYDAETIEVVRRWFKEDIGLFGYTFDDECSN